MLVREGVAEVKARTIRHGLLSALDIWDYLLLYDQKHMSLALKPAEI